MSAMTTMTRFTLLTLLTGAALLASACGTNDEGDKLRRPETATDPKPAETPAAQPPPRRLISGSALPTSPINLIADPGFGLVGQQAAFGSFLALDEESMSPLDLATTLDSRSPAGFGGAVALVKPEGATNTKSAAIMLLTSFPGGPGPFHAEVWVSKSDLAGKPEELSIDAFGIRASITDGTPDGEAFGLLAVDGASRIAGGRTWTLLRTDVVKPLVYGGYFVVHTGTGGGQFHVAAPVVVPQPLVDGLAATRSLSPSSIRSRPKTATERSAILRYKSKLPQLVPAAPTPRLGE